MLQALQLIFGSALIWCNDISSSLHWDSCFFDFYLATRRTALSFYGTFYLGWKVILLFNDVFYWGVSELDEIYGSRFYSFCPGQRNESDRNEIKATIKQSPNFTWCEPSWSGLDTIDSFLFFFKLRTKKLIKYIAITGFNRDRYFAKPSIEWAQCRCEIRDLYLFASQYHRFAVASNPHFTLGIE